MDKLIVLPLAADPIAELADRLAPEAGTPPDLSQTAVVFGGKRPALFLKRALARTFGSAYIPPRCFTMDALMEHLASGGRPLRRISDLEACHTIYRLAHQLAPSLLRKQERFSRFLPWASEINSFLEQIDIEDVPAESLEAVERTADIGFDIPESMNELLRHLARPRVAYHDFLAGRGLMSRGLTYLAAARAAAQSGIPGFQRVVFCGLFYLHRTEEQVVRAAGDQRILLFQGDERDWPTLAETARKLGCSLRPEAADRRPEITLHAAVDTHSQAALARELLADPAGRGETVVVLPEPGHLLPVLSELSPLDTELNISLGCPVTRSAVHSLLAAVLQAQRTRRDAAGDSVYYARDYLRLLAHPLAKNLELAGDPAVGRVLVHKIEELLTGAEPGPLGGRLFIRAADVEQLDALYSSAGRMLSGMGLPADRPTLEQTVAALHRILLAPWEHPGDLGALNTALRTLLTALLEQSPAARYPVNLAVIEKLLDLGDQIAASDLGREPLEPEDLFRVLEELLEHEVVAFPGSPLKGLQILGVLEARLLAFDTVVVLDAAESVLPRMHIREPLVPRDIMISLGLSRLERDEEIQRYHFTQLIAPARRVHLICAENDRQEASRFLARLAWDGERGALVPPPARSARVAYRTELVRREPAYGKSPAIVEFLRGFRFSATSLDTYLACPARFYYRYVLGLRETLRLAEDPEPRDVGDFIHRFLESAYRPWVNQFPPLDDAFREHFFHVFEQEFARTFADRLHTDAFLMREVMRVNLERLLEAEARRRAADGRDGVEQILWLERSIEEHTLNLPAGAFRCTARIDRLDLMKDGTALILDYKSGGTSGSAPSARLLSGMQPTRVSVRAAVRSFQLPLYFELCRPLVTHPLDAGLFGLREQTITRLSKSGDPQEITRQCMSGLDVVLGELVSPNVPFTPDFSDEAYCGYCPYDALCG